MENHRESPSNRMSMSISLDHDHIVANYDPAEDVKKIADHFGQRYGSLQKALATFPEKHEFTLDAFEQALRTWGIKTERYVELFDHIDIDYNGSISVQELFGVLELSAQELKRREERRRREEARHVNEQLAKCIAEQHGSVNKAVEKFGLQSSHVEVGKPSQLSKIQFRNLVKKLGIRLDWAAVERAFHEIDKDGDGEVTVNELQAALCAPLVRDALLTIAEALVGPSPDCAAPSFELLADSLREAPALEGQPMTEDRFLDVLHRLKAIGAPGRQEELASRKITKEAAHLVHASMAPFTCQQFVQRLQEEQQWHQEKQLQIQQDEQCRKEEEERFLRAPERHRPVAEGVHSWAEQTTGMFDIDLEAEKVLTRWHASARAGNSTEQLRDYATALNELLEAKVRETQELRNSIQEDERALLSAPPIPEGSPVPTPRLVAADGAVDFRTRQSKAEKAERLIQAAAVGNLQVLQTCVDLRIDVDTPAWHGVTALMSAARHGQQAALARLLDARADLGRTDMSGHTAVDYAQRRPRLQAWLRQHGGRTGRELAADAEVLAKRLLQVKKELAGLQDKRSRMPRKEVLQIARERQAQRTGISLALLQSPGPALGRALSAPVPGVMPPQIHTAF